MGIEVVIGGGQWNHMDGIVNICIRAMDPLSKVAQKAAACDLIATLATRLKEAAEHVVPAYQVKADKILICLD
jgi:hypothetical protein